jgi:hypothetical protein
MKNFRSGLGLLSVTLRCRGASTVFAISSGGERNPSWVIGFGAAAVLGAAAFCVAAVCAMRGAVTSIALAAVVRNQRSIARGGKTPIAYSRVWEIADK